MSWGKGATHGEPTGKKAGKQRGMGEVAPDIEGARWARKAAGHEARGAGPEEARTGTVRQPAGEDACPTVFDRAGRQRCHYDIHHAQL